MSATTDRAIISWNPTTFNIAPGELFSFQVPAGGGILNKVGYGTNGSTTTTTDTAYINGTLQSNGRVFVLANGNIFIGGNASVSTQGGLYLSTLLEPDNFNFSALGNLSLTGASTGSITIGGINAGQPAPGTGGTPVAPPDYRLNKVNVVGNLGAWAGSVAIDNLLVTGDMIVNQKNASAGLTLTGADGTTAITGNLAVTTNLGTIGQTAAQALTVGNATTINTNGNVAVTLNANAANNFNSVTANTGSLLLRDADSIIIGASTIGTTLSIQAVNNITTSGAVAIAAAGTANLVTTGAGNVTFANGSTVSGAVGATVASGNLTVQLAGPLTIGNTTAGLAVSVPAGTANFTSTGVTTIGGAVSAAQSLISGTSVISSGGSVTNTGSAATFTSTAGSIILPTITAPNVAVTASGGSISQFGTSTITTTAATATSDFNANGTGAISLTNATNAFNSPILTFNGTNIAVTNTLPLTIGTTNATGSVTINTTPSARGAGAVTLGSGFGTAASGLNVAGALNITTNASTVTEDNTVDNIVFGTTTINTTASGAGQVVLTIPVVSGGTGYTSAPTVTFTGGGFTTTATANAVIVNGTVTAINVTNLGAGYTSAPTIGFSTSGSTTAAVAGSPVLALPTADVTFLSAEAGRLGSGRYGQWNITGNNINISENTAINLGNIVAYSSFRSNSTASDTNLNGTMTVYSVASQGNATTGNNALYFRGTSGAIAEAGAGVINLLNGGTASFQSSNSFGTNLSNASNVFTGAVQFSQGLNNIVVSSSNFTLASATCVVAGGSSTNITTVGPAGNNRITVLGNSTTVRANSAGDIVVGAVTVGNLSLTAADTSANSITQSAAFSQVNGTLTISSQGNVVLNNVGNNITGSGLVLNNQVGDATVYSSRNLTVNGNSAGNVTVAAGTSSTGSFSNAWNLILGNLNVRSLTARAFNGNTTVGALGAGSVTVGGTGYLAGGSGTTPLVISAPDQPNGTQAVGTATVVSGVVTALSFSNTGTGYLVTPTISVSGANTTGATAAATLAGGNATAGNSGNITQQNANARVHTENTVDLATFNGNILLSNNGNSFGRVQASTGGATGLAGTGTITIVEDPGLRVGNIATSGAASLTSRFGSIIEDTNAAVNVTANGTGITLNAPAGSVQLGNQTGLTTGNITAVSMVAAGSAQIFSTGNLVLGATDVNSLLVTANAITQSGPLHVFGSASFTATNAAAPATSGGITLTDTGNNFGPVTINVTAPNQSAAITEASTLNLRTVSLSLTGGNGTFSATSVGGDVIDTGLAGVKLGGSSPGGTNVIGSGIVSLTATNGNIVIDDPTSDVLTNAGVAFNAKNVTLAVLGSPGVSLVLGANGTASSATGNLTASSALGNIGSGGAFTVGGIASFQTGTGNITIDQANTGFGSLRFIGNQVRISESGNMDILTGSSAFGPAQLVAGGSIQIVPGDGTVTFGNTVAFQANGNITLRQMQAVGAVTLSHTGTANLSALSKSTDLNSRDPIDLGTGPGPATDATLAPKP